MRGATNPASRVTTVHDMCAKILPICSPSRASLIGKTLTRMSFCTVPLGDLAGLEITRLAAFLRGAGALFFEGSPFFEKTGGEETF